MMRSTARLAVGATKPPKATKSAVSRNGKVAARPARSSTASTRAKSNGAVARTSRGEAGRARIDIASTDAVVRPLKTSERVARDIVRDIIERRLSTGQGLPAEAAMLDHYGVSRESLREGLRLLEVQGLITIRRGPGGGPIVGTVDPANLGRISSLYFYMAGATYRELIEAWIVAEGMLAARAARNPDAELRRELMGPYVVDPDNSHDSGVDDYVRAHVEFHGAVARLGDNRVLELTLQVFGQIASHHFAVEDDPRNIHAHISLSHGDLAAAIIAGRPSRAMAIMTEHLEFVAEEIEQRMGRLDDYIDWR